ncbi:hypothetical protein GCM10009096_23530 [Parasphingorhabdus litoris]|uniref:SMI1/KNR4 family protein n=1 Tax=Parasphingorhabdus litoris TaxID=394733 RepID=A0ABP3KII1_9SPHN|nr:YrhA family protein [Parasphingorhabdus litoris]
MKETLELIAVEQRTASENVHAPASHDHIENLKAEAKSRLSAELPDEFLDFLALYDGVDFNGVVIYGSHQSHDNRDQSGFWQGLIAANAEWRESGDHEEYVILGETGMDILTVDKNGQKPAARDRVSGDIVEEFPSTAMMIERYLKAHL